MTALALDEESRERNGGVGVASLEEPTKQRRPEGAGILWDGVQAWNGLCGDPSPIPDPSRDEVAAPVNTQPQSHGIAAGFGVQDFPYSVLQIPNFPRLSDASSPALV